MDGLNASASAQSAHGNGQIYLSPTAGSSMMQLNVDYTATAANCDRSTIDKLSIDPALFGQEERDTHKKKSPEDDSRWEP